MFFIRPLVLAVEQLEKFKFLIFFKKLGFWKTQKFWIFQAVLRPKLMVVWKTFPVPKNFIIVWIFEWNHSHTKKIIFGNFRVKNVFWKKLIFSQIFENFQALLQSKLFVVWKKFPGSKICKNVWIFKWNHSHAKKIIFGNFRAKNVFLKKIDFLLFFWNFWFFFQVQILQALWKNFVLSKFLKLNVLSFYLLFLPLKNI